ncbi:hypothetical protein KAU33_11425 [Candidatus Dependentiae bacterium]|nr:hypothetical protein [Candidatus Dependentiae bacterium]
MQRRGKIVFFVILFVFTFITGTRIYSQQYKASDWDPMVTLGVNGFFTSFDSMSSTSMGFSIGYWPIEAIEYGGDLRLDLSSSEFEGSEFSSTSTTISGYIRWYYFPDKKYIAKLKGMGQKQPNYKIYMGASIGVSSITSESKFAGFNFKSEESETSIRIDVCGMQKKLAKNLSLNFNFLSVDLLIGEDDAGDMDLDFDLISSISLRILIPVRRK